MENYLPNQIWLVNDPGNPRVKNPDPYFYPFKPVPLAHGYGYCGVRVRGGTGTGVTRQVSISITT
jgi:hypothetical protein